ncbi:methyltransferase family protein [Salegentibacter chungangensis]|uniref:Methyltransferase family protein n=1 Tax=Salegentibacter chungangensis TaxID=1335724 RepID=A0ABW3NV95_9FLAO
MKLKSKDYILVGIQAAIFMLYIFDLQILQLSFPQLIKDAALIVSILGWIIVLVAILQLNRNLSPFPSPKADSKLVQNGLYKYIRHPVYFGILIGLGGIAIYSLSGYRVILTLALYVLFDIKSIYEEKLLMTKFPGYRDYRKKTGRFFPRIKKPHKS